MNTAELRHRNDCPRCPIIGHEHLPATDSCQLLSLRFNLQVARELSRNRLASPVDSRGLSRWLQEREIDWEHVDHLPLTLGPGIIATLPSGCGMPLIDGNHRAARALRDRKPFFAVILPERETLELLCQSLGKNIAKDYWRKIARSKPHPKDIGQGE